MLIIKVILFSIFFTECHGDIRMDLWFLLDGMESASDKEFESSVNFTSSLAEKFNISKPKVQVGCSLSSHDNYTPFYFDNTTDVEDFQSTMSAVTKPTTRKFNQNFSF